MKLFLISQDENQNYDMFDSAVVAAENEDAARLIHPEGSWKKPVHSDFTAWASSPEKVAVTYIGEAKEGTEAGIILASFNAG